MEAWSRRELVAEWNQRKLNHIAALYANTNFDNEDNDREGRIQEIERHYERVKSELMMSPGERKQIDEAAETDFMKAGRRALSRSLEHANPEMPGERTIRGMSE